jgi:hypothetical protein
MSARRQPGFALSSAAEGRPVRVHGPTELNFTLQDEGVRLAGVVLDATGGPVPGAIVRAVRDDGERLRATHLESAEDGSFELWIAPGQLTLYGEAEGYAPAVAFTLAPRDNVELVLTPGGGVRGRVVSALDPVAGVRVEAQPQDFSQFPPPPAYSDEDGAFQLAGLQPGAYFLGAGGAQARGAYPRAVHLDLGEVLRDLVLEVVPAVTLSDQVLLRKDATPCESGVVHIGARVPESGTAEDAPQLPSLSTSVVDGEFRFEGLVPGRHGIAAPISTG